MKNTNTPERFIYCLEGNWNRHPKSNQSIKPILDLLYTFSKVKYIYHKCPTKENFIKGLETFTQKRYSNYTVLYIAYHGLGDNIKEFLGTDKGLDFINDFKRDHPGVDVFGNKGMIREVIKDNQRDMKTRFKARSPTFETF